MGLLFLMVTLLFGVGLLLFFLCRFARLPARSVRRTCQKRRDDEAQQPPGATKDYGAVYNQPTNKERMSTIYKHYVSTFMDMQNKRWALVVAYPDTPETSKYPHVKEVRIGDPAVILSTESDSAISPVVKGRLSFSLYEESATQRYRHLVQAPEGSVSVILLELGDKKEIEDAELLALPEKYNPLDNDANCFWRGVLDPESYKEPANQSTGYLVSFEAGDFGRLSRVTLRAGSSQVAKIGSRMQLREILGRLVSLSFGDWDREQSKKTSGWNNSAILSRIISWAARHLSEEPDRYFYIDTAQFIEDSDNPLSAMEALERILLSLSMRIEQVDGVYVVTDLPTIAGNIDAGQVSSSNKAGEIDLSPHALQPKGDDGEISALPARGNVVLTTHTHLETIARAFTAAPLLYEAQWITVPRADVWSTTIPGWRYRTDHSMYVSEVRQIETEEISCGEDRLLYALVYNHRSIHGRIDRLFSEYSVFLTNETGFAPHGGTWVNRAVRLVDEDGNVETMKAGAYDQEFSYVLSRSFAVTASIPVEDLQVYVSMVRRYRDMLNSPALNFGEALRQSKPWTLSLPRIPDGTKYGLRLDLPLLLSLGQDIFQPAKEDTMLNIDLYSTSPEGRIDGPLEEEDKRRRDTAKRCIEFNNKFTDTLEEVRIYFSLSARGSKGTVYLYDTRQQRERPLGARGLGWSSGVPRDENTPYLSYGGYGNKLSWGGSWNHPSLSKVDTLGEGMYIPLPPDGYDQLELQIYSIPHFYTRENGRLVLFNKWRLWSVPSAILCQAPSLWLSDPIGRRNDELSQDRKERFTFTNTTSEGTEEEMHLSSGVGIASLSPSIVRTVEGSSLSEYLYKDRTSGYTQSLLSNYRAECFGVIYGALPARGYELTGTFVYHRPPSKRVYAGMDWLAVSREIDIQRGTERGTYHQVRRPSDIRPESLKPELLDGDKEREEKYDSFSPRYNDYSTGRPPRRGR